MRFHGKMCRRNSARWCAPLRPIRLKGVQNLFALCSEIIKKRGQECRAPNRNQSQVFIGQQRHQRFLLEFQPCRRSARIRMAQR